MVIRDLIPDVVAICIIGIVVGLMGLYILIRQQND